MQQLADLSRLQVVRARAASQGALSSTLLRVCFETCNARDWESRAKDPPESPDNTNQHATPSSASRPAVAARTDASAASPPSRRSLADSLEVVPMQNRSGPAWEAALAGVPQQRHGEEAVDQAIGGADDDRGADDAGGADDDSAEQLQVKTGDTLTSQPDTPPLCSPALPALPEHALHTSHPLALMSDACPPLSLTLPSPPFLSGVWLLCGAAS